MSNSIFRVEVSGGARVKAYVFRDCDPDFTPNLPRMDEVIVLSYTDGSMKVGAGSNLDLDAVVEVVMRGLGTVAQKTVQGRTIFTLVARESTVLDGDKLVADMVHFVHLAQRQDPEVLRAEWEARQERREHSRDQRGDKGNRPGRPRGEGQANGPRKGNRGGAKPKGGGATSASSQQPTLADAKGGEALKGLKPAAPEQAVRPPPSPAQRATEKASEVIARLMTTPAGQNAVAAARMACGVSMSGPIPAAKLKEVAEMAEMLLE